MPTRLLSKVVIGLSTRGIDMEVVCDAGGCCAIKTIRDLQYSSPDLWGSLPESKGHDHDQNTTATADLFYEPWQHVSESRAKSKMTHREMFMFLFDQIRERRPAGMIIVNLASYGSYSTRWEKILTSLGFKSTKLFNSNSCNEVIQYSLIYDMGVCRGCGCLRCSCDGDEDSCYDCD